MRAIMLGLCGMAVLAGCGTSDTTEVNTGNYPVSGGSGVANVRTPASGYSGIYGKGEIPEMTQDELFRFQRQVAQMNATSSLPKSEQIKASDLLKMEMYARSKSNNLSQSDAFRLQRQIAQLKATGD